MPMVLHLLIVVLSLRSPAFLSNESILYNLCFSRAGIGIAATASTSELDHIVAMTFQWWDLVIKARKPFEGEY